ncbi:ATP-binding protein [Streptomyces sp. 4N509B]|uniref:ATP-binding protein n=1 Tax=Streptomyces sp. 4N509B TaxID=3457413 RepID=UPI003FD5D7FD
MLDELGHLFPPVDTRTPSSTASLGLPGQPDSVRRARDFARTTLLGWRLSEQFDSVGLVVSELVTNALRHGMRRRRQEHDPGAMDGGAPTPVELELMRYARRLICAVRDESDAAPRIGTVSEVADPAAESGRGLHLVECFSDGWGWRPLAGEGRGKVVWAVFKIS